MRLLNNSIRSYILALIIVMGMWALGLALITAHLSSNYVLESEKHAFERLMDIHIDELIKKLASNSTNLALKMQHEKKFRDAFKKKDKTDLTELLNDQFRQYYYTAGIINIKKLIVFDTSFEIIAQSTSQTTLIDNIEKNCVGLFHLAKQRSGPERIKPINRLCLHQNKPYHFNLSAIGGLILKGYVLVISDPTEVFHALENRLGFPITIKDSSDEIRYQTTKVDKTDSSNRKIMQLKHIIYADQHQKAYTFIIDRDITQLSSELKQFVTYVALIALVMTLVVVLVSISIFRKSIILPLEHMVRHFKKIVRSTSMLGEPVDIRVSNQDVSTLVDSFNSMNAHVHELNQRLETMAYQDALTKVCNRLAFNEKLQRLVSSSRKTDEGFCIFIIDLNKFKQINDTMGHHVGDELLKHVTATIAANIRDSDILARLGGDEFGIIFPSLTDKKVAEELANGLVNEVCRPVELSGHTIKPGLSIGIAFYNDQSGNIEEVLKTADHAMYEAKKSGSGFCHHSDVPSTDAQ